MSKLIPKHQNSSGPLEIQDVDWELIPEYAEYLKSLYKEIEDFPTWLKKQIIILSNNKNEKVSEDKRSKKQRDKESKQGEAIHNQQQRKELEAKVNRGIWTGIGLGGLALAQATPAAPYIDAAFATHGALGLAKQHNEGTLGLNLETGLHALEMLPVGIRGVGKAIKYADDAAREAYAPYDFYRTIKETTPDIKGIPYNVGWGPKQTIKVVHATDSQDPLRLFFDKRWDVTTEGANPFGVWYLGKWGLPRTAATNSLPGKAEKAARARKLFENRKYKHLGEVTLEKPLITVGDVPDRSALSYTAEKMGADGLIYNNVYDNGFDNNLVILSFKTHSNKPMGGEMQAPSTTTPKIGTSEPFDYETFNKQIIDVFAKRAKVKGGFDISDIVEANGSTKEGARIIAEKYLSSIGLDVNNPNYKIALTDVIRQLKTNFKDTPGFGWFGKKIVHIDEDAIRKALGNHGIGYIKAHEYGHSLRIPHEKIEDSVFDFSGADPGLIEYFTKGNNAEIAERFSQVLNFHGITDGRRFTADEWRKMWQEYIANIGKTTIDNNIVTDSFIPYVKDWDKLFEWANDHRNVLGLGIPTTVIGINNTTNGNK